MSTLIAALGSGQTSSAADAFAPDALFAYWDGRGDESGPRTVVRGQREATGALSRGVPGELRVSTCLTADRECFVEGSLLNGSSGEWTGTFIAALTLDSVGAVARVLSYHCPPVGSPPVTAADGSSHVTGGALTVLGEYFGHLGAGRFQDAVDCFTEDCLYSHPPYGPGLPRAEFRGHSELLAGLEKRGPRAWTYDLVTTIQRGADCFTEGVVPNVPGGGSFISSLSLAPDGRIHRYVAFYCSPSVSSGSAIGAWAPCASPPPPAPPRALPYA